MFLVKTLIVVIMFFSGVAILLPNTKDMREHWNEFISKKENRALVFSFIQNPVALTMSGERDMERKNYEEATLKFELAVGLLEMHGASPATLKTYQARLQQAQKLAEKATLDLSPHKGGH